jgi:hypothetical protein
MEICKICDQGIPEGSTTCPCADRQDAAFYKYTSEPYTNVWDRPDKCRFYVVSTGEMRILYHPDPESSEQQILRYTDDLEKIGIETDSDLEAFNALGDEMFEWVNNPWFEIYDREDGDFFSEPMYELDEAISLAVELHEQNYPVDKESPNVI